MKQNPRAEVGAISWVYQQIRSVTIQEINKKRLKVYYCILFLDPFLCNFVRLKTIDKDFFKNGKIYPFFNIIKIVILNNTLIEKIGNDIYL